MKLLSLQQRIFFLLKSTEIVMESPIKERGLMKAYGRSKIIHMLLTALHQYQRAHLTAKEIMLEEEVRMMKKRTMMKLQCLSEHIQEVRWTQIQAVKTGDGVEE